MTGGSVTQVDFSSSNTTVASVTTPDTTGPAYTSDVTANSIGLATITATVTGTDGTNTCTASDSVTVGATAPNAWWQVQGAPVTTNGDLVSLISTNCQSPGCDPVLVRDSAASVAYGGLTYDFSASNTGLNSLGFASSKRWIARTTAAPTTYNYSYINSLITSDVVVNPLGSSINNGNLNSGTSYQGYYWYKVAGNSQISSNITIPANRKVVLLVDGNLTISGNIRFAGGGNNFFMIATGGDINIDPSVGGSSPDISALLLANGRIQTGAGNTRLHIHGSVVALQGFTLERDLVAGNSNTSAEFFEYDPKIMLFFPSQLQPDFVNWREVAP